LEKKVNKDYRVQHN